MLIYFKTDTGEITMTVDYLYEPTPPNQGEDCLVTYVEHGNNISTMRVDPKTKTLVPKSAIIFAPNTHETIAGEPVIVSFLYEGEQFGEHFPLRVNNETVLAVPYNEPQIELTLELPGEYVLSIPDFRIHSIPQRIRVRENIQ